MAYYDALIAAWNGAQQPPAGVTGTALTAGMTTAQKLAAVNAWTVGGAPTPMVVPTYVIFNLIDDAEWAAVGTSPNGSAKQQVVRDILSMGTVDASPGTNIRARLQAIFTNALAPLTRAALVAEAAKYDASPTPWWKANGYTSPFNLTGDIAKAGLT